MLHRTHSLCVSFTQVNFDCALSSEKRIAVVQPSGMATAIVDSCTSLVSHVLDYHLASMIDDGFIEQAWKNHLSRQGTIECIQDTSNNGWFDESDTFSLTLVDVGGIFIVHIVLSLCAIALATGQFYVKYKKGLLPQSRNLGSAFGVDFARKKLLKSRGHRNLITNDGDISDVVAVASETARNRMDLDSSSAGSAFHEAESDSLVTESNADVSGCQCNYLEGDKDKGIGDASQDKIPSVETADDESVQINSNDSRDSAGSQISSLQSCGIDDGSAQENSKKKREIAETSERMEL